MAHKKQSLAEEILNSITHGLGLLLSIAGLVVLIVLAARYGDAWRAVSFSVYGASLVILYLASTLYHSFPLGRAKDVFRIIDHSAIYILIAGSYTPFALISLRGGWGWALFGIIWSLALLGIVFKIFFVKRFLVLSTLIYLAMGWLSLIAVRPMLASIHTGGILWLLAGGMFYTLGIFFHFLKDIPFNHAMWHLAVLAGAIFHFFAMIYHVVPHPGA